MLEIRPTCEHCNRPLPPDSGEARICSYECTFCADCVESVLQDVCPNCGGGFTARPVRPRREWRTGVSLRHQPASTKVVHQPVAVAAHAEFAAKVVGTAPHQR